MSDSSNGTTTTESRIKELEERRSQLRDATAKARKEQYAKDLEHILALEEEFGPDRLHVLHMNSFVAGLPTVVVIKPPTPSYMNRFRDQVRRAASGQKTVDMGKARDQLADVCIAFPDAETYARMKEAWTGIHDNAGVEAVKLGEAEGKT